MPDNGDDDEVRSQKTYRGYAHPEAGVPADPHDKLAEAEPPPSPLSPEYDQPSLTESGELYLPPGTIEKDDPHAFAPLVEIEVNHQHGPAPRMDEPSQVLEVWTQNRVYTMDASMLCVRVMDRASGQIDPKHGFIGYRLVGGQHRDGETFELSYPYPRPGTEAVFEHPTESRGRFSRTSTVHRVVLRLHVVTVSPNRLVPTWADITAHEKNEV